MKPLTLSQRLFLVTMVASLPAFGTLYLSVRESQQENARVVHQEASRASEQTALEMERLIYGAEIVLRALSVTPIVRDGDFSVCSRLVTDMAASVPSLSAIAVINPDGLARCASIHDRPAPSFADREYLIEAMATSGRIVGTFTIERMTGDNVLPIAIKIGGTEGAPLGVAVAYMNLDWLQARLRERTYVEGSSVTIADRNGTILAREPKPEEFVGTVIPEEFQYLLTKPKPGTLELTSQDQTRRVLGYVPVAKIVNGLYVSHGFAIADAYASTWEIAVKGSLIALAGIVLAFMLALYTSRLFVVQPIRKLIKTVEAWRAGNIDARTGMRATGGDLASAGAALDIFFDELIAARAERQNSETRREMLLAELEHRGRNLLTLIQAIARQTFSKTASQAEVRAFSGRLRAISEANSMLRQEHWQSASLAKLIQSTLEPFTEGLTDRIVVSGPPLMLHSDVVLSFSMAFYELGTNAVKYGALSNNSGTVSITWKLEPGPDGDRLELIWQERGGPKVSTPKKRGFGATVIEQVLSSHTDGEVKLFYDAEGLVCRMTMAVGKALFGGREGRAMTAAR